MLKFAKPAAVALLVSAVPAAAEMQLDVYTGYQTAPSSRVSGRYPAAVGGTYSRDISWRGRSFEMPPYYGLRATWWQSETLGFGIEFTHAKVYSSAADRAAIGFSQLEFTDGLNILTLNATQRWPGAWANGRMTPYISGGLGVAIPHSELQVAGQPAKEQYEITGPAGRVTAGARYDINERWSVFGEYQFTISDNDTSMPGGGSFSSTIMTNALNVGVGLSF